MGDLKAYKSKLQELTALIDKLEGGDLTVQELSTMEGLTRDLHERSIILKYKAFESHAGVAPVDEVEEVAPIPEPVVEKVVEKEEEDIEFNIFDEGETDEEETEPEIDIMSFGEPEAEPEVDPTTITPVPEIHIEEVVEPVVEAVKEEEPEVEPEVERPQTSGSRSFLDRLDLQDNSLASQFSGGKLDSLVGAFGLNQRLSFINNLFDGSSELFSDAVKILDTQNSLEEASVKAEAYSAEHEWDLEDESVIEFMTFLKRRYA